MAVHLSWKSVPIQQQDLLSLSLVQEEKATMLHMLHFMDDLGRSRKMDNTDDY